MVRPLLCKMKGASLECSFGEVDLLNKSSVQELVMLNSQRRFDLVNKDSITVF